MKKLITFLFFVFFSLQIIAQNTVEEAKEPEKLWSASVGLLNGGGGLIGFDLERMIDNHFSIQAGFSITGYGAAINYHIKPRINSSMFSFALIHPGIGKNYILTAIGPSFTYRAKKIFFAQFGMSYVIDKGAFFHEVFKEKDFDRMLTYSIGVYFPF